MLTPRFKTKVNYTNTCWLWTGCTNNKGYGKFFFNGRIQYAHRVSWQCTYGPIPEKMNVLHKCDTPACVNPKHLFLGDQRDNLNDCVAKGRKNALCGSAVHMAKLDEQKVLEIRQSKLRNPELAKLYGVKSNTISNIKTYKTWKHI